MKYLTTIFIAFMLAIASGCQFESNQKDAGRIEPTNDVNNSISGSPLEDPVVESRMVEFGSSDTKPTLKAYNPDKKNEPVKTTRLYNSAYSPVCYKLGVNTYIDLPANTGSTYCIYHDIPQTARSHFMVLGVQSTDSVRQEIFQDRNANHSFTFLNETNSNGGSTIDYMKATEAGHYYQQVRIIQGSGQPIRILSTVNTSKVDQYEPNDSFLESATLSGNLDYDTYNGGLDDLGDVDYFSYEADNGQVIEVYLDDPHGIFKLEFLNGNSWVELAGNSMWLLNAGGTPMTFHFRVMSFNDSVVYPDEIYGLHLASQIDRLTSVRTWSDENLVDPVGMYRKFHNELKWEAQLLDTEGGPIKGARVEYEWGTSSINFSYDYATSGDDGFARGTIATPDCTGDFDIDRKDIATKDMWHIEYDPAIVRYKSVERPILTVGHDPDYPLMAYHVCDEDLMFSFQYMQNYEQNGVGSCSNSTIYCPEFNGDQDGNGIIWAPEYSDSSLKWKHRANIHDDDLPIFKP